MISNKLDTDRFFRQPDSVGALVPASDVFGFLSRSLRLPSGFAALALREHGDRTVIAPGGEVPADGVSEVLFVRTSPLELSLAAENLLTKDKYLCSGRVGLRVAVVPERAELDSFRTHLLGSNPVIRVPAVARHLDRGVADAVRRFCADHDVESLVDGRNAEEAFAAVREALKAPCFEAGLALAGAMSVEFESQALWEVRAKEAAAAKRLEEHAAQQQVEAALADARAKHLDTLEKTLKKLQAMATESPQTSLPDLLRTFGESERGKLYAALFESEAIAPATRWLVAACGPHLLFFSPESFEAPARKVTLEGTIGPLRSIQSAVTGGERRIFAGASRGVYEMGVESSTAEVVYAVDAAEGIRGGVNAVTVLGDDVFATHSELGLLRWDRKQPAQWMASLRNLTRGAAAVRNVHTAGGRVVFSLDDRVVAFRPADEEHPHVYTGSGSVVTAALAVDDQVFAGNADGQVLHWADGATGAPRVLHGGSGRAAESVAILSVGGVNRLLFTDTTLAVFARVLGDTFTCRYEAGGQTIRRVDAASDLMVGTTDARDRLVIWRPNRPALPVATINVARLTGHTVQDVTLIPI